MLRVRRSVIDRKRTVRCHFPFSLRQVLAKEDGEGAQIGDLIGVEEIRISQAQIRLRRHDPGKQSKSAGTPYISLHHGVCFAQDRFVAKKKHGQANIGSHSTPIGKRGWQRYRGAPGETQAGKNQKNENPANARHAHHPLPCVAARPEGVKADGREQENVDAETDGGACARFRAQQPHRGKHNRRAEGKIEAHEKAHAGRGRGAYLFLHCDLTDGAHGFSGCPNVQEAASVRIHFGLAEAPRRRQMTKVNHDRP